jgi:hypothetical protein
MVKNVLIGKNSGCGGCRCNFAAGFVRSRFIFNERREAMVNGAFLNFSRNSKCR